MWKKKKINICQLWNLETNYTSRLKANEQHIHKFGWKFWQAGINMQYILGMRQINSYLESSWFGLQGWLFLSLTLLSEFQDYISKQDMVISSCKLPNSPFIIIINIICHLHKPCRSKYYFSYSSISTYIYIYIYMGLILLIKMTSSEKTCYCNSDSQNFWTTCQILMKFGVQRFSLSTYEF